MQPDTVCDLIKEKGDELVEKVSGSDAAAYTKEQIEKIKEEARKEGEKAAENKIKDLFNGDTEE